MAIKPAHDEPGQRAQDTGTDSHENSRAARDLERELKKFRVLYDLAIAMTTEHGLKENLRLVVDKSRELLDADTAYIALCDEERGDVFMHTLAGIRTDAFKKMRIPIGKGLGGLVAKTRKGFIVDDYFAEKSLDRVVDEIVAEEGVLSGMAVPLQMGSRNFGVLYVFNRTRTRFSQSDLDTLFLIGNLAAVEIARNRADEGLRKSEETVQALLNATSDRALLLDAEGIILALNRTFAESMGKNMDDLIGLNAFDLFSPDLATKRRAYHDEVIRSGRPLQYEDVRQTVFLDTYLYPVFDAKGRVALVGVFSRDVTKLKRAEEELKEHRTRLEELVLERTRELSETNEQLKHEIEERKRVEVALRESEDRARAILNAITETVVLIDKEGKILAANIVASQRLGKNIDELAGACIYDLFPPALAKTRRAAAEKAVRTGMPVRTEDERGGRTYGVHWYPVFNAHGEVVQVAVFATDITDTRRLETQLQHIQRMEAIGTLAGGIAHNFNNLLMGIQGNASLARLEVDPSHPNYSKLEQIEKLVQSGSKLTSQLLGYAREGKYEVRPIGLNRLVKETSHTFGLTRKGIRIHYDLEEGLHGVEADQGQIEQVLLNLYVNAADAMPRGGDLYLKTCNVTHKAMEGRHYRPKHGNYVLLTVRDTGVGIDQNVVDHIFEPFFTTKGLGRGTGLGLASVYGIIKAHGGYIHVSSEKGEGTAFEIYLPATRKKGTLEKEHPKDFLMGNGTILFVDDEDMVVEVGQEILKRLGYQVLVGRSGKEAIHIYERDQGKIDLVILDMIMPDMDGGEAYDRLKGINTGIKVLLSSGYDIDGQAEQILKRGCDGFLQKPFTLEQLSQKIREVLSRKGT